jgi:H+/Cl- antiporter ClcA
MEQSKKAPYWLSSLSATTTTLFFLYIGLRVIPVFVSVGIIRAFLLIVCGFCVGLIGRVAIEGWITCFRKGFNTKPE